MKQIAINLLDNVSCVIRANPGTHSPSNVITPPQSDKVRADGVYSD